MPEQHTLRRIPPTGYHPQDAGFERAQSFSSESGNDSHCRLHESYRTRDRNDSTKYIQSTFIYATPRSRSRRGFVFILPFALSSTCDDRCTWIQSPGTCWHMAIQSTLINPALKSSRIPNHQYRLNLMKFGRLPNPRSQRGIPGVKGTLKMNGDEVRSAASRTWEATPSFIGLNGWPTFWAISILDHSVTCSSLQNTAGEIASTMEKCPPLVEMASSVHGPSRLVVSRTSRFGRICLPRCSNARSH